MSRFTLLFVVAVLFLHNQAWPQNDSQESAPDTRDESDNLEIITVTGSRIKKTEFSSSSPLEIITTEKSALSGLLTASDILQGGTFATGQQIDDSFSAFVIAGGLGAKPISLRGLGAQRTLVLVNGKRWVPSGVGGSVNSTDLTAIPEFWVQQYEILKDGASSIYGADAVAGVINVITDQTREGLSVGLKLNRPQDISQGDIRFDAFWGNTGGNWTFTLGGTFHSRNAIKQNQLSYARCETRPRLTDQDNTGTIDNRDPDTGEELCFGTIHGFAVTPFGWARYEPSLSSPDETNPDYDPVINGEAGIPYFTTLPTSSLDNAGPYYQDELNYAVSDAVPEENTYAITSLGNYDFSLVERNATAYYELFYNHRQTSANLGYRQLFPTVSAENPFNPFGVYGPLGEDNGTSALPVLMTYHIEEPINAVDVSRTQLFTGLKGDLSNSWTYDAYVGMGVSEGHYRRQVILDDRLQASLNVSETEAGQIICNEPSRYPGCVPIDLFSEQALLHGRLDEDATDFLTKDTVGKTVYETKMLSTYATGELFDLQGGSAAAVVGLEYRHEAINDRPDIESINDNFYGSSAAGVSKGEDEVTEVFTELELPIVAGFPLLEALDLKLAGRYTHYKSFGSDETFQVGINWSVTRWFQLKGTHGTSFRAPDLYEQFLGDQTGFADGFIDPCKSYRETSDPGDILYENCNSLSFPDSYFEEVPGIQTVTGGSDNLRAETSTSSTYGFVIQPDELNLSLKLTWWEIVIENTLTSLSATQILDACYFSQDFSSPYCRRIGARDERGNITAVDASFINVGEQKTKGYDIDFLYEKSFPRFDMAFDLSASYLDEFSEDILAEQYDYEGHFAFPFWNADLDVTLDWKEWTVNWHVDWIGDTQEDRVYDPDTTNVDRVTWTGDEYYHTLGISYDLGEVILVTSIRNIFDENPPMVADGSGSLTASRVYNTLPGAGYPLYGRHFALNIVFNL